MDCFTSLGLHQWVTTPTFVRSDNIIDLALTSESDRVGELKIMSPLPNCGHCPVLLCYYFQFGVTTDNPPLIKRSWHRGKYNLINDRLSEIDWNFEFLNLSIDGMYNRFLSIVRPLIERYVPVSPKTLPTTKISPPKSLKTLRKKAWDAYKTARSTCGRQSPQAIQALAHYDILNSNFRNYFTHKQIDHERSLLQQLKHSSKPFHQYIRSKKVGTPSVGPLRMDCGQLTSDCTQMANTFASHFSFVYSRQAISNP